MTCTDGRHIHGTEAATPAYAWRQAAAAGPHLMLNTGATMPALQSRMSMAGREIVHEQHRTLWKRRYDPQGTAASSAAGTLVTNTTTSRHIAAATTRLGT